MRSPGGGCQSGGGPGVVAELQDSRRASSPLQKVRNGRPADVFMSLVHLDEQRHIEGGVFARKGRSRGTVAFGQGDRSQAVTLPPGDQTRESMAAVCPRAAACPQDLRRLRWKKRFWSSMRAHRA
jgi:hypothetical protein